MTDSTRSSFQDDSPLRGAMDHVHPQVDGFTLVMTPPLPPFLRGGFGRVYRAVNPAGMLVAIKVPHPLGLDAAMLERWNEECRSSLALPPHEHLVTFYGRVTARWPSGTETPALVMEWLEGARGLIPYADSAGLDKVERLALFRQALDGVAWLHAHGTPHCDLKSSNLLVIERGRSPVVKVADFGGTRRGGRSDPSPPIYSPHRVAPEVIAGDPAAIDARADVFSLGKELAELIGGPGAVTPHPGEAEWRAKPLESERGLRDSALDEIVARATAPVRGDRYADARELLEALANYRPPGRERWARALESRLWPRRNSTRRFARPLVALAVLMLLCVGLTALLSVAAVAFRAGPEIRLPGAEVTDLSHVAVIRGEDAGELVRVAQHLGISGVSAESRGSWRRVWARVLDEVVAMNPSVVVFDIVFPSLDEPELNTVIADAMHRARKVGVPVVVATHDYTPGRPHQHGGPLQLAKEIVNAAAAWGCYRLEPVHGFEKALFVPRSSQGEVRLPLAAAAVASSIDRGRSVAVTMDASLEALQFHHGLDAPRSVVLFDVRPRRALWLEDPGGLQPDDQVGVFPFEAPQPAAIAAIDRTVMQCVAPSETEREALRELINGRVVFLAAWSEQDVHPVRDGRSMPGVWLHATATEALMQGVAAPRLRTLDSVLSLGIVPVAMALAMLVTARRLQSRGLNMPSLGGSWSTSILQPAVARRRWRNAAIALMMTTAAAVALWIASRSMPVHVHFHTAILLIGAVAGAIGGAAVALVAGWMGLVRLAWSLDHADTLEA
ncbi:MAG: CHASE2 domain-containing protein [Phycisphaeraceae bacterium]|nr:CHASE2 domain-containing protein [Phycisphaeraceae bacterium]